METTEKNRFSILLEQLINMGEVKNSSLATALRYDPSYISKWSDRARRAGWKR